MAYSNSYSPAQIMAMQKDAVRRVNEMQRVAQEKLRQTESTIGGHPPPEEPAPQRHEAPSPGQDNSPRPAGGHPPSPQGISHTSTHPHGGHMNQNHGPGRPPPPPPAEPPPPQPEPAPVAEAELVASPFQGILQRLNLDQDSVLLIVMLLLLINEGADVMLIMALVYILL